MCLSYKGWCAQPPWQEVSPGINCGFTPPYLRNYANTDIVSMFGRKRRDTGGKGGHENYELESVVGAYTMRAGRLFLLLYTDSIYTSMPITSTSLPISKNSQSSHLLLLPWDCKIKSCPSLLCSEAILSKLWAVICVFGFPQYTILPQSSRTGAFLVLVPP